MNCTYWQCKFCYMHFYFDILVTFHFIIFQSCCLIFCQEKRNLNITFIRFKFVLLKGGTAPQTKISMFCALSQNYQHLLKNIISIPKQAKKLKTDIQISLGLRIFEFPIKTCKIMFWSIIQEPLGLFAIFEFLWQFASRCIYYFSKQYW